MKLGYNNWHYWKVLGSEVHKCIKLLTALKGSIVGFKVALLFIYENKLLIMYCRRVEVQRGWWLSWLEGRLRISVLLNVPVSNPKMTSTFYEPIVTKTVN